MIRVSVRADLAGLQRQLNDFARRQVPFATAQALNAVARKVQAGQKELLRQTFDKPTPYTLGSVRMQAARKSDLRARVFVGDAIGNYLAPYIEGGRTKLIGRGRTWFNPKHAPLDQYGNLSASTLRRLKARSDVFIGPIKTRKGVVNGVWQRGKVSGGRMKPGSYGSKGRIGKPRGGLTLLIRFGDAIQVRQRLPWYSNAERIIRREFRAEFEAAMAKALRSSTR